MHGKAIAATLSLAISIDSTTRFTPGFVPEKDAREVYGLPLSAIVAKQLEMGLTIDPLKLSAQTNTLLLPGVSNTTANFPLNLYRSSKPILLPRLTALYGKSIPFGGNHQVKDQHWWRQLSALLRPSSIIPPGVAMDCS